MHAHTHTHERTQIEAICQKSVIKGSLLLNDNNVWLQNENGIKIKWIPFSFYVSRFFKKINPQSDNSCIR